MSLHFKTNITQKNSHQKKQNEANIFLKSKTIQNNKINNDNNLNPTTIIIKKSRRFTKLKNDDVKMNNINLEKKDENKKVIENFIEQTTKQKNNSKKATTNSIRDKLAKKTELAPKTVIIHKSKKKLENVPNVLRKSMNSQDKNIFNKNNNNNYNLNYIKDENNEVNRYLKNKSASKNLKKKNNYLKESINLNLFNFDDDQSAREIEEKKVNKLIEKSNSKNTKELYKISEENHNEINSVFSSNPKNNSFHQKEAEKNNNHDLYQSANNNIINTDLIYNRSLNRKTTFQTPDIFDKDKMRFRFEKKGSLNISSSLQLNTFKNSIRDFTKPNNNKHINNIIIPLINKRKENNCFLNVIIQNLTHLEKFKDEFLLEENEDIYSKSKPIFELYDLIKLYQSEQMKYKKIINNNRLDKENKFKIKLEPIISVNNFRFSLNQIYNRYHKGESGDPMETMNSIFDLIHEEFCKMKKIDKKKIKNCHCLAHKHFSLILADIQLCPSCNKKKVQLYDKDCFMYNIYISEIVNKLHGKSFNSFKSKFFQKLKEYNETFEERKRIPGCNCSEKLMESYIKTTKIMGPINTYLIINITWSDEFPCMNEILKTYTMIPPSEEINNLFTFKEALKSLTDYTFYLKGIILYGLYHYVCTLYIKEEKRWAIIDDKTIKYIDKYFNLIDSLLRNHLMPVGLIYSKDENDALNDAVINSMNLNKDEYIKLYNFCKEIDKNRGLKTSEIFQSKINFDEEKGDYFNNNLFFNNLDKKNDETKTQQLIKNIKIEKDENKKEIKNMDNNCDEEKEKDKEKNKKNKGMIFSFSSKKENNLEDEIKLISGNNHKILDNNKDKDNKNDENVDDLLDLGKNYEF